MKGAEKVLAFLLRTFPEFLMRTLKKPTILFITRMFLPALLHWLLTQMLAKHCINPGWRGAIMNWTSLGGSWCLYINRIQLKLVEYFISSWQSVAASAIIQWIIELSYAEFSMKMNKEVYNLETENKNMRTKTSIEKSDFCSSNESQEKNSGTNNHRKDYWKCDSIVKRPMQLRSGTTLC